MALALLKDHLVFSAKELTMMNNVKHATGAVGYSMLYMLVGGGIGGAILIFIIAKVLGH